MNKRISTLLSLIVLSSALSTPAFSAVKAGTTCKKVGSIATSAGKKFTCIKSGKKLIWSRGVALSKPAAEPVATSTPTQSQTQTPKDTLNFKNPMIYNVKGGQLIRKGDSGDFFESDSRLQSNFNPIRLKAYQELNPSNPDNSHPNINFIYSISDSFPSFLVEYSKRELDEAASSK